MVKRALLLTICLVLASASWATPVFAANKTGLRFRAAGTIQSVDYHSSTFTLLTRRAREVIIRVDDDTHFRSRSGEIHDLRDLEAGMRAAVVGIRDGSDILAKVIATVLPSDRPRPIHAAGRISGVSLRDSEFTVHTRSGTDLTLSVGPRTRFVSRSDHFDGLEDLERGMMVRVVYAEPESGPLALIVRVARGTDRDFSGDRMGEGQVGG